MGLSAHLTLLFFTALESTVCACLFVCVCVGPDLYFQPCEHTSVPVAERRSPFLITQVE